MLMLSKIENGDQSEKVYAEIYLRDLACEVLNEFAEAIKKRNLTATINGDGKVLGDQNMIFELIENLVSTRSNTTKRADQLPFQFSKRVKTFAYM